MIKKWLMMAVLLGLFGQTAAATDTATPAYETATFAGGCFWCMESDFEKLKEEISHIFKVVLSEHESSWWGIYALGRTPTIEEIKIYPNFVEGEGFHEEQGSYSYLLGLSSSENNNEIPELVSASRNKFRLIAHNEI